MAILRQWITLGLLVFTASGCADIIPVTDLTDPGAGISVVRADLRSSVDVEVAIRASIARKRHDHDVIFQSAAELEPWFAGLYLAGSDIMVLSTDLEVPQERVTALLEGIFKVAQRPGLVERVPLARIVGASWSFAELASWLDLLRPDLHKFGVGAIDIDERANQIGLWVDETSRVTELTDWAVAQGVPVGAVKVLPLEPGRFTHHVGGHGVDVWLSSIDDTIGCTLTQGVTHMLPSIEADSSVYAVTASHCTSAFGSASGDTFRAGNQDVAEEIWDHPRITDARCQALVGHPSPFCRYSDAALFRYEAAFAGSVHHHRVVTTTDSLHSEAMAFVGDSVYMSGQASGTISGEVTTTCHDLIIPLPPWMSGNIGLLCFGGADYASAEGDSGGPLWLHETVGGNTLRLFTGIQSYKLMNGGSYFSHAESVMEEIVPSGSGWGTICLSFPGPIVSPGSWTCWW